MDQAKELVASYFTKERYGQAFSDPRIDFLPLECCGLKLTVSQDQSKYPGTGLGLCFITRAEAKTILKHVYTSDIVSGNKNTTGVWSPGKLDAEGKCLENMMKLFEMNWKIATDTWGEEKFSEVPTNVINDKIDSNQMNIVMYTEGVNGFYVPGHLNILDRVCSGCRRYAPQCCIDCINYRIPDMKLIEMPRFCTSMCSHLFPERHLVGCRR